MLRSLARSAPAWSRAVDSSATLAAPATLSASVCNAVQSVPQPRERQGPHSARWLAVAAAAVAASASTAATAAPASHCDDARAPSGAHGDAMTLYQYAVCPWCNKAKAVLDYCNVPYHAVEVHPLFRSQLKWSSYKKVPVLLLPSGDQVNGSSAIVDTLWENRQSVPDTKQAKKGWFGRGKDVPKPGADAEEEARWRDWADTRLVRVFTANLYSSLGESYQSMEYILDTESFSYMSRTVGYAAGGFVMWWVGRGLPAKYGLDGKDLRAELLATVNEFVDAVGKRDFMGGAQPNRADLAVFGMLRAVPTTETFKAIMTQSRILPWWTRMVETVGESAAIEELPEA